MKQKQIIVTLFFALIFCFSCFRKTEVILLNSEVSLNEETLKNELFLFFDTKIKKFYFEDVTAGARDFYFRFKQTDSNDTIFEFSFFIINAPIINELEYKGFLQIDSFNIALYDEKNLLTDFYKENLYMESFPNRNNYAGIKRETGIIIHLISIGWLKDGKLETVPAVESARQDWDKYFK